MGNKASAPSVENVFNQLGLGILCAANSKIGKYALDCNSDDLIANNNAYYGYAYYTSNDVHNWNSPNCLAVDPAYCGGVTKVNGQWQITAADGTGTNIYGSNPNDAHNKLNDYYNETDYYNSAAFRHSVGAIGSGDVDVVAIDSSIEGVKESIDGPYWSSISSNN